MLDEESKKDEQLLSDHPNLSAVALQSLRSTYPLQACRSAVSDAAERLRKSVEVTKGLSTRMDAAMSDLFFLRQPVEEIEEQMPHLDGTPLAEEPCVLALRDLIEQLEQIKIDCAAMLGAARESADSQRSEMLSVIEQRVLVEGAQVETVFATLLEPFEQLRSSLDDVLQRRARLLDSIAVEHTRFTDAKGAASAYPAREDFFRRLLNGADEMVALHAGFTEGIGFYTTTCKQLEQHNKDALHISDLREQDRKRLASPPAAPTTSAPPASSSATAAPHVTPSPYPSQPYNPAQPYNAAQPYTPVQPYAQPSPAPYPQSANNRPPPYSAATQAPRPAHPSVVQAYATPHQPPMATVTAVGGHSALPTVSSRPVAPPSARPASSAAPAPGKIACFQCRRHFGVPPGTKVVACPFCQSHNRVPGT